MSDDGYYPGNYTAPDPQTPHTRDDTQARINDPQTNPSPTIQHPAKDLEDGREIW